MANTLRFKRGLVAGIPTGVAGEPLFTTDTFDLYIGNGTTNTRFQQYIASGTTLQYLRGDGTLATFPTNIVTGTGVSGQVAYWSGTNTQVGSAGLVFNGTNRLTIDGGASGYIVGPTGEMLIGEDGAGLYIGAGFGINTPIPILYGSNGTTIHIWKANSAERMRLTANGRLLLGTTTEGTQRLQVSGDTLLKGSGNTSATTGLTVQNSDAANAFRVLNNGQINLGNSASFPVIRTVTEASISTQAIAGTKLLLISQDTETGSGASFAFSSNTITHTSGNLTFSQFSRDFTPTSGTGTATTLRIGGTINQTGGANGITRGLYVNPTLTAAADWRSIETSNNTGWSYYGAGTANSYFGGNIGIGATGLSSTNLRITKNITGLSVSNGIVHSGTVQSDVTTVGSYFQSVASTQAAAFTTEIKHYAAQQGTFGAGSTVSVQYGFEANSTLIGATNNYGFYGNIPSGTGRWNLYMNGTAANYINGNTIMGTLAADSGEKLQVNGTMKVTGASTFGGNMALTLNQNSDTKFTITNTSTLAAAQSRIILTGSNGIGIFGKTNINYLAYKTIAANNMYLVNDTAGNIAILNDFASGNINMAAGGSSTAHFTIASTGAATFSSSVTAASGIITGNLTVDTNTFFVDSVNNRVGVGTVTPTQTFEVTGNQRITSGFFEFFGGVVYPQISRNNTTGGFILNTSGTVSLSNSLFSVRNNSGSDYLTIFGSGAATFSSTLTTGGNILLGASASTVGALNFIKTGTSPVASRLTFGTDGTGYSFAIGKNQAGTVTDLFSILDSGAANFTTSIQAGTAISIGTTPDTNKPFKILKNINATVGINFENTSTSSLAFSAIQMGTDVTGGTKFTNLVYASSGVSASGVYNPDGTSLINNGAGGLNFLGNPIRFYTGGSNGVLRLYFDNEGTTQLNATSPTTSITDGYRQYSADVVAGNAAPHFRTENGAVIKLYQETTGVGNAIISLGGGSAVLDDTTFDGYTLRQIVKALRNQGILA